MASLTVEVLAPEAVLWSGSASALVARSSEGDFTVMAGYAPTVGDIVATVVRVASEAEGEVAFAVHAGFFQVGPGGAEGETRATVLASVAERTDEIDVARAQAALERAQGELAAASASDDPSGYVRSLEALQRAELRLRAAARELARRHVVEQLALLGLELVEAGLDDVADRHDPHQAAVFDDGDVAKAPRGHGREHLEQVGRLLADGDLVGHVLAHRHLERRAAAGRDRPDRVALREDPGEGRARSGDDQRPDAPLGEQGDGRGHGLVLVDRGDLAALGLEYGRYVHQSPLVNSGPRGS
jgi:F-type H+-transporting ATPase subunit epsilon